MKKIRNLDSFSEFIVNQQLRAINFAQQVFSFFLSIPHDDFTSILDLDHL